jgi:D-alanyl-D-alanine carboxypeptidase/D-alanyl-D-alanine-endopeptidase (penicillin-binding protein 4)
MKTRVCHTFLMLPCAWVAGAVLLTFPARAQAPDTIQTSAAGATERIAENARTALLDQRALRGAHVGVCVYDPATGQYLYTHAADRYFTPASNTKLYTFYTGLTHLGDSTTGIQYRVENDTLYIRGTGDPSFLHPDFPHQPAFEFLRRTKLPIVMVNPPYENKVFGPGWSWEDYNEDYQPERSAFPIYGNVAWFTVKNHRIQVMPRYFAHRRRLVRSSRMKTRSFYVHRSAKENLFRYNLHVTNDSDPQQVPFMTHKGETAAKLLADTLHKPVRFEPRRRLSPGGWVTVHNVPVDSLFRHMMYRSDNFYAEQTDQMTSMKLFDTISTRRTIDYMLDGALKDLPDTPTWVDGSGLSRFNLFTPRDMISILDRLYQGFAPARIDSMLPTGGKGTLSSLYHDISGSIFAKTGSLSHEVSLSGYLITRSGRTLLFSILINQCVYPLSAARLAMQNFLHTVWENN